MTILFINVSSLNFFVFSTRFSKRLQWQTYVVSLVYSLDIWNYWLKRTSVVRRMDSVQREYQRRLRREKWKVSIYWFVISLYWSHVDHVTIVTSKDLRERGCQLSIQFSDLPTIRDYICERGAVVSMSWHTKIPYSSNYRSNVVSLV